MGSRFVNWVSGWQPDFLPRITRAPRRSRRREAVEAAAARRSRAVTAVVEAVESRVLLSGAANDHTVLILGTSVTNGLSSKEAQAARNQGMDVELVTAAGWQAKTRAEFASYRALILGDPTCGGSAPNYVGAAESTASVWGPAVNGNVIINGTDPVFHPQGSTLVNQSVAFAVSQPGKTGAYVSLSCYYAAAPANTAVPALNGLSTFGTFRVQAAPGCFNDVHIAASHPALAGLTDASLSNWGCSVHEVFNSWPADYQVLALARTGSSFTASDGTVGTPYILARGVTVVSDIHIAPAATTASVGHSTAFTATVTQDGLPVVGRPVTFTVVAGPNTGRTGVVNTDAAGQATFTYSGSVAGADLVHAQFVDGLGRTQTSENARVDWMITDTTPTLNPPGAQAANEGQDTDFNVGSFTDPDGGPWVGEVDWGDETEESHFGSMTDGAIGTLPHKYDDNGIYHVTVTVLDNTDRMDSKTFDVTVNNVAPQGVSLAGPSAGTTTVPLSFAGSAADPSEADTAAGLTYAWDVTRDGSRVDLGATDTGLESLSFTPDVAGTYHVTLTVGDKDGGLTEAAQDVTVQRAATDLEVGAATGTYGGATTLTATLGASGTPLAGHPVIFSLDGAPVGSATTDEHGVATLGGVSLAGIDAHGYAGGVSAEFQADDTYAASTGSADLTVDKAALTVTETGIAKTYGQAVTPAGAVDGLRNGEVITAIFVSDGASAAADVGTGSYPITETLDDGGSGHLANYDVQVVDATLNVAKAHLTVTADDQAKTYGEANPALTYHIDGFVLGQDAASAGVSGAPVLSTTADEHSTVAGGPYAITVDSAGTLAAANYDFPADEFVAGHLTVGKADLVVGADDATRSYGDANPGLTGHLTGVVADDDIAASYSTAANGSSDVGAYAITPSLSDADGRLANYNVTTSGGTLTVTPRAVAVTADSQAKVYGDGDPALTYEITAGNLVNGDVFSGALARDPGENVGSYAIRQGTLALSSNYALSYAGGDLAINKATLTVAADDKSRYYGAGNPAFTGTFSGAKNGETFTIGGGTGATSASPVGTYAIAPTVDGATLANYNVVTVPGTLTVTYPTSALTDLSKPKNGGSTLALKLQVTDASGGNLSSAALGLKALGISPASAGAATMPATDAGGANPGSLFRYDPALGGYVFNLKLVDTAGNRLTAGTYTFYYQIGGDPVTHSFQFSVS